MFADFAKLPNLPAAVATLPVAAAGLILRDLDLYDSRVIRRACLIARHRRVRVALSPGQSASGPDGIHIKSAQVRPRVRARFVVTSAHNATEIRRAARLGSHLIFVSPVFATTSHPGAAPLGVPRWRLLCGRLRSRAAALGGISAASLRQLPPWCRAVAAINALAPKTAASLHPDAVAQNSPAESGAITRT